MPFSKYSNGSSDFMRRAQLGVPQEFLCNGIYQFLDDEDRPVGTLEFEPLKNSRDVTVHAQFTGTDLRDLWSTLFTQYKHALSLLKQEGVDNVVAVIPKDTNPNLHLLLAKGGFDMTKPEMWQKHVLSLEDTPWAL